jgi:hypothetical protein
VRIRRLLIDLARATRRQQDACRARNRDGAVPTKKARTHAAAILDHEVDDACMIVRRDTREARRPRPEHTAYLPAGRVVCVKHAPSAVRCFHRQRRLSARNAIELHAPRDQFTDKSRAVLHQDLHGPFVTQAIARRDRICSVPLGAVAWSDGCGNPALCVTGVAFSRFCLGKNEDIAVPGDLRGRAKRGDAAADDEKVRVKLQAVADAVILPSPRR